MIKSGAVAVTGEVSSECRRWPAVIGTADAGLGIERISADAEELFLLPVAELLGTSLLGLVSGDDVESCRSALENASFKPEGVTLQVGLRTESEQPAPPYEAVFLPLRPSPSCIFILLPIPEGRPSHPMEASLSAILLRFARDDSETRRMSSVFRSLTEIDSPALRGLTVREIEIVNHLLQGDRVPAIAAKLFLSQSTVRNHLASVFCKLGVSSQQQLLDSFR